jgi:hypothetical protein
MFPLSCFKFQRNVWKRCTWSEKEGPAACRTRVKKATVEMNSWTIFIFDVIGHGGKDFSKRTAYTRAPQVLVIAALPKIAYSLAASYTCFFFFYFIFFSLSFPIPR